MSQEVIINGRTANIAPDNALVINRVARFAPLAVNGLMPTDVTINGLTRPPVLPGSVLNLPLYHSALSNPGSFKSLDAYRHDCTVTGALWTPQGRKLDGVVDYINCGKAGLVGVQKTNYSFGIWINPAKVNVNESPFGEEYTDEASISVQWRFGVGVRFGDGTNVEIVTMANPSVGQWTFRVFTFSGGGYKTTYIDDKAPTIQATALPFIRARVHDLWIGRYHTSYFGGIVGEFFDGNRTWSADEVSNLYHATKWRYQ